PGIETRLRLAGGCNAAQEAGCHVLTAAPAMQVRIVENRTTGHAVASKAHALSHGSPEAAKFLRRDRRGASGCRELRGTLNTRNESALAVLGRRGAERGHTRGRCSGRNNIVHRDQPATAGTADPREIDTESLGDGACSRRGTQTATGFGSGTWL